jgi:hypothetical protein
MGKQTKKVTLESLAATMEAGFKRMDEGFKDTKEENESLARLVANGFEHTSTKDDIAKLEQGQENIQLRVDSLAPQFEVKGLERRVKRLEDRAGIRHTIHSQ